MEERQKHHHSLLQRAENETGNFCNFIVMLDTGNAGGGGGGGMGA